MKKMLTMVAGAAVLASAAMGTANAQGKASGPFADVPTDHWAYQSVEKLRDAGIVIGYPDGTYGGRRAMTRYEFATAIARLLALIPPQSVTVPGPAPGTYVTPGQLNNYALKSDLPSGFAKQSDLDALRAEVMRRLEEHDGAIAALRNLVNQFQPELDKLGANVAAVNVRLDALDKRVTALEEAVRRVTITGDLNFIGRSSITTSDNTPLDHDGYRVSSSKSLWAQPQVYNDILLNIVGKVSETSKATIKIDAGNYLPWLGSATEAIAGTHSPLGPAAGPGNPNTEQFSIYEAYLTSTPGNGGATATIGRFGTQFTALTLKGIDPDSYTVLPETDSGDVITDGLKGEAGLAGAHVTAFAGKAAPIDNYSITANPSFSNSGFRRPGTGVPAGSGSESWGSNPIDNLAGVRATFGNTDKWTAGLTGVIARTTGVATDPNKGQPITTAGVYGADFNGLIPFVPGLSVDAEFAIDQTGNGSRFGNVNSDKGNEAWKALLGYNWKSINVKAGYREIYGNYNAPGYWGHIGSWVNPSNIKGPEVYAGAGLAKNLTLHVEGQFYQGIDNANLVSNAGTADSPLGSRDHLNRSEVGLRYGITPTTAIDLGYEYVQWDLKNNYGPGGTGPLLAAGKPTEQYITIGVGHDLSKNTAVKLLYQVIDYSDHGTGFDPNGDSHGGVLVGQASVKF